MVTLHFVLFPELLYLKQRIDEATPNKKPVQTSVGMRRFQISLSLTHTHTYTRVRANSDDDLQRTQKHLSFVDRSCAKNLLDLPPVGIFLERSANFDQRDVTT